MNEQIWKESITMEECPSWPCPSCNVGTLVLVPDSIATGLTKSGDIYGDDGQHYFDPSELEHAFSCWLECSIKKCGQRVAVVGDGGLEPEWDEQEGQTWEDYYSPRFMFPMPDVFAVPKQCPPNVATELRASFALLWADRNAAAGRLRTALERLLTAVGIKERARVKGKGGKPGRNRRLPLHERLQSLALRDAAIAENLMGIKWLCNTGTHETAKITREDLLSAYLVMSDALDELVSQRTKVIAKLAKQLAKKHA